MKTNEDLEKLYTEDYVHTYLEKDPIRLDRLIKHMNLDSSFRVVDLACGNGMLMDFISPRVKSYTGVDFSELFIAEANKRQKELSIKNATFACADINDFCAHNLDHFDVAFAMDFSEHVYDKEWTKILKSIHSSLKHGGKLYIHTPNAEYFIEIMKENDFILEQFPQHIAVRTTDDNKAIIEDAGFSISRALLLPHYNILRLTHPLSFIPFIGKFFKARIFIEAEKY